MIPERKMPRSFFMRIAVGLPFRVCQCGLLSLSISTSVYSSTANFLTIGLLRKVPVDRYRRVSVNRMLRIRETRDLIFVVRSHEI